MSEIVRLYKYKELLLGKRAVTRQELMERQASAPDPVRRP